MVSQLEKEYAVGTEFSFGSRRQFIHEHAGDAQILSFSFLGVPTLLPLSATMDDPAVFRALLNDFSMPSIQLDTSSPLGTIPYRCWQMPSQMNPNWKSLYCLFFYCFFCIWISKQLAKPKKGMRSLVYFGKTSKAHPIIMGQNKQTAHQKSWKVQSTCPFRRI